MHLRRVDELLSKSDPAVVLSDAEIWSAAKIRSFPQRKAFLAGRKLAREVLSVPLNCAPAAVPIPDGTDGERGLLKKGIQFNLSHCRDWCAVAWSEQGHVGVGVETIRTVPGMNSLVNDFFPLDAQRAFHAAGTRNQTAVFFRWWAQIEAAMKASGRGLDDSYTCLDQTLHAVCDSVSGLVLAVAAVGKGPLNISWHLA